MEKIRVAVIGYGHLGKWHCEKAEANEHCQLIAVVEQSLENRAIASQKYGEERVVATLNEVIDKIDAAIIVSPTSTHFDFTKILLQSGKHVFCEKPLCQSLHEAEELQKYLGENQILQVGHSERFHQVWDTLKETISKIESPLCVRINRLGVFKGRATDVSVVEDLMIHDLDLISYLFGKKIKSINAFGHKIRTKSWDHVTCIMEANDRSVFEITAGRNYVQEVRTLEMVWNGGAVLIDLFKNEIHFGHNDQEKQNFVESGTYVKRDHLALEQENFYLSIQQKEEVIVGYQAGLSAMTLIHHVNESLRQEKAVLF